MRSKNLIIFVIGVVLFVCTIALCIAAIGGHNLAYAAASCCFFAATAGMLSLKHFINKN